MTDRQSINDMASAMIALPSILILLLMFRTWCRGYASKRLVGSRVTKRQMTRRVLGAMSWRVALILLLVIPGFLSVAGSSPEEAGRYAGVGIGFAFLAFPIVMLSLWQVARRFSHHAFLAAASEDTISDAPRVQLLGIARVLDSTASQPIPPEAHLISVTACQAALRAKRFFPTIVEGGFLAIVALLIGSLALSITLPARHRRASLAAAPPPQPTSDAQELTDIPTLPKRTTSSSAIATATDVGSPPSTPARPTSVPHFSTRTEAAIAGWNKLNPTAPASHELRAAMHDAETTAGAFVSASAAVDTDAILDPKATRRDAIPQLHAFKKAATEMLSAIQRHKAQTRIDLRRTRFSTTEQQQILKNTSEGYRLMEAWAAEAVQAADAGITLRDLVARGLPADRAEQHFIDTWNANSEAQQGVIERATKTQKRADNILRK